VSGAGIEQVASFPALVAAAKRAARGKKLTAESSRFMVDLEGEVLQLERELTSDTWRPGPYRTFRILDPKPRTISAAPFRDRVVHHALCAVLEPVIESVLGPHTYACRSGMGTDAALRAAKLAVATCSEFLKLDIRHYFETIDHNRVRVQLAALDLDARVLRLCEHVLAANVSGSEPARGLPIGNLTSQHFANLHLAGLDDAVGADFPDLIYIRYMDDLVFFGTARSRLRAVEAMASAHIEGLGLVVKTEVTRRGPTTAGVPFLGFRLWPAHVRLDRARRQRLIAKLKSACAESEHDEARAAARLQSLITWAGSGGGLGLVRAFHARDPP